MTEQKYRLTVYTPLAYSFQSLDGTLDEIIEQLERVSLVVDSPLQWAEEVETLIRCGECGNHSWRTGWWYWFDKAQDRRFYFKRRPTPTVPSVQRFAYQILAGDIRGFKKWEDYITLHPLPEEDN